MSIMRPVQAEAWQIYVADNDSDLQSAQMAVMLDKPDSIASTPPLPPHHHRRVRQVRRV